jgi:hypothetical protein
MTDPLKYKEHLSETLRGTKAIVPDKYWKSYNLITIDNFISHVDDIKNERVKAKTCDEIMKYLESVNVIAKTNEYNQETVKDLDKCIYNISDIFKWDAGFVVRPSYPLIILVMLAWFFLLRISFDLTKAIIIAAITFSLIILYYTVKTKQKKIY